MPLPPTMGVVTRAKKRRLEQEEEEEHVGDRISTLPDDVLFDIVSLLPTKDGARTQVLSSRWRHLWRSAPLDLDLQDDDSNYHGILASDISDILSAHPGPCRRFVMPRLYRPERPTASTMLGWLRSPALHDLQELVIPCDCHGLLLPSVHRRFSPTLCAARFIDCISFPTFPGGNDAAAGLFHWPVLEHLTLFRVKILETSLQALLAGCPVLESLLLLHCSGFDRLQVVSHSLRSIGVHSSYFFKCYMHQLVIEDAPRLERLLYFRGTEMDISVISAPRLAVLGKLFDSFPRLQFGSMVFQGSTIVSMPGAVVSSVKVLALNDVKLCLDAVINLLQCFPQLQKLHMKIESVLGKDWCTNHKHTSTLDIGLRKIVLRNYRGDKSHINLARFFVSNARLLESMRFEIEGANISTSWIEKQKRLLQIEKSACNGAQFDFVSPSLLIRSLEDHRAKQVQDLSTDPFDKFLY